jgi:hypothetical protein
MTISLENPMPYLIILLATLLSLWSLAPAQAQHAGSHVPSDAAGVLNSLPPDLYRKLQQLSLLLDQNIKAGRITEAQVRQELMSGELEHTIRSLGPEAAQLMDEFKTDISAGKGPGEDALMPLLGGLSGMGR